MYADRMSSDGGGDRETERRRAIQSAYNEEHGITPKTIIKAVQDIIEREKEETRRSRSGRPLDPQGRRNLLSASDRKKYIKALEREMLEAAKNLEFERAAVIRDEIVAVRDGDFIG